MKRASDSKIKVRLILALATLALLGVNAEQIRRTLFERPADPVRAQVVFNALDALRTDIRQVQSEAFAAAVSGNEEQFPSDVAYRERVRPRLDALRSSLQDDAEQTKSIDELISLMGDNADQLQHMREAYAAGGFEAAARQAMGPSAAEKNSALGATMAKIKDAQMRWLQGQVDSSNHGLYQTLAVRVTMSLLELGMLFAVYAALMRYIARHKDDVKALKQSEMFARSTVDALSAQIAILDGWGCILAMNKAWREFPETPDMLIARAAEGTNYLAVLDAATGKHRNEAAIIAAGIRDVVSGRKHEVCLEYAGHVKDVQRWFACRMTRFPGEGETRVVVSHEDITARKHAEEEVEKARVISDVANNSKSAFLANMSHEIRTPMSAILGYAELILDPAQTSGDRNKCVGIIRRNGEHLLALINDILDISKIEAGKCTAEKIHCDITELISDIVSMVRVKAIQKGLDFKVVFDGPIPQRIKSDPVRLKQIMVNLVSNAIKFTRSGGKVRLRVACQESLDSSIVHFDVVDSGIGMTELQQHRLFQPFTQADESTTRQFGGTGLGLTISKRLAQLLGGDITLSSEQGVGSVFSVWVDGGALAGVKFLHGLCDADLAADTETVSLGQGDLRGRVLLAEDGEDNQQLIALHLTSAGAEVVIAGNGRIAVERCEAETFDLVLMDMQMPELDGYGATQVLRAKGYKTPIIALTANAMAEDRGKCLAAGCDDYLAKPIRAEQLLAAVSKYLKRADDTAAPTSNESTDSSPIPAPAARTATGAALLRSELAGNAKLANVLNGFISRLPDRVDKLMNLLRQREMDALEGAIHQLKGAAGGYGFPDLSNAAGRAEQRIRNSEGIDAVATEVKTLIELISRVDGLPRSASTTVIVPTGSMQNAPVEPPALRVDVLTGMLNRPYLDKHFPAQLSMARREGSMLACVVIEPDRFDVIRQTYHSTFTDNVLRQLACMVLDQCEPNDSAYRSAQDQFVVLLPGKDLFDAASFAKRIQAFVMETTFGPTELHLQLTCSFGVAQATMGIVSSDELLEMAVSAVARVKDAGPNHVELATAAPREVVPDRALMALVP